MFFNNNRFICRDTCATSSELGVGREGHAALFWVEQADVHILDGSRRAGRSSDHVAHDVRSLSISIFVHHDRTCGTGPLQVADDLENGGERSVGCKVTTVLLRRLGDIFTLHFKADELIVSKKTMH